MTKPDLIFLSNHILSLATKNDQLITLPQLQLIMYYTLKNLVMRKDIDQFLETAYHHDGAYVTATGPQFKTVEQRYHNYFDRPLLNFGKFHPQIDNGTNQRINLLLKLPAASLLALFQASPYYKRYLNIETPLTLEQIDAQKNTQIYQIHSWNEVDGYQLVANHADIILTTIDLPIANQKLAELQTNRHNHCYLETIEL